MLLTNEFECIFFFFENNSLMGSLGNPKMLFYALMQTFGNINFKSVSLNVHNPFNIPM